MSFQSVNSDTSKSSLESVRLNFLNWRRDPHKTSRIPKALWDEVIQLLSHHSKSKVLSSVGISYSQLTQHLKSREKRVDVPGAFLFPAEKNLTNESNFVKAVIMPEQSVNYFDVVLIKSNGATLKINKLPQGEMLKLAQRFVE